MKRYSMLMVVGLASLSLGFAVVGCDSGGGDDDGTSGSGDGAGTGTADGTDPGAGTTDGTGITDGTGDGSDVVIPQTVPESCAYDVALKGSTVGKHIENFSLKTWDQAKHELHYDCGDEVKAVWIFLSTGWCGVCENYAPTVEQFYQDHKADGLRVLWIVGEDQNYAPPTWEYMEQYWEAKDVTFTIVRDAGFQQVYAYLDPSVPALPHQYLLDGKTMELVFKSGGVDEEGENKMLELLGVQ